MERENQANDPGGRTSVEAAGAAGAGEPVAPPEPVAVEGSGIPGDATIDDEPPRRQRKTRRPGGKRGLSLPRRFRKKQPGAPAGIEPEELPTPPKTAGAVRITCIDYGPDQHHSEEVR